jgi:hypothetical protein
MNNDGLLIAALVIIGYLVAIPGMYVLCLFINDGLGTPHKTDDVWTAVLWPGIFIFLSILIVLSIPLAWGAILRGGWENIQTTWEKYHAE